MNNFEMSSNVFELAEHKTYLELTRRLCWYGQPNYNNVELPVENAEEKAQTLVGQPVVAKYKRINKKDDMGGHECSINQDGELIFNTTPIGVNTAVEIKNDNVEINGEIVNIPCLFATSRIWKRNKNICSAIKRLFSEKLLHSSWEIAIDQYEVIGSKKILKEYEFEADCLLGSKTKPAYGNCASTIAIAQENADPNILMAEAIQKDFKDESKEENFKDMENSPINSTVADTGTKITNVSDSVTNPVVSDLTDRDLRRGIEKAYRDKYNQWVWLSYMFPNEKYALLEAEDRASELEYIKVSYSVENNNISIGDSETINLVVGVASINDEFDKKNSEINDKNDALVKASEEIKALKAEIEGLSEYKEMYEKSEKEKRDKELAEKQETLKNYAVKSGYISAEEIESSEEIKSMIASVDTNAIKAIIADRFMSEKNNSVNNAEKLINTDDVVTSSLVNDINDSEVDYKSVIQDFLKK